MTLLLLNTLNSSCAAHKRVQSDPYNDFQHAVKIFNQERVVFFEIWSALHDMGPINHVSRINYRTCYYRENMSQH